MSRISKDECFLWVARISSLRSTCVRRQVGCVLVSDTGLVLSTGYNGNAAGLPHCIDEPCAGSGMQSGTGLDICEAIHAEQNALIQCKDHQHIGTCYCTTLPCMHCLKMLLNTSCYRIVYEDTYGDVEKVNALWVKKGHRLLEQIECKSNPFGLSGTKS